MTMITMGELVHSQLELIPFSPTPQYTLASLELVHLLGTC